MSLDATFRPLATKLLRGLSGRTVTFVRVTQGVYDPATSSATPTEVQSTVYTYRMAPDRRRLDAGQVQAGDVIFMLSAENLGFAPAPADRIIDGSESWRVVEVKAISSGQQDALYEALARRN